MNGNVGYVRLFRSLLGHPAFRNDAEAMAFAWMIARAAWRPVRLRYKGKAVPLLRGELVTSQRDMAVALDRDKAWIERLLRRLGREAMVKARVEAGLTVVSICNYDRFQGSSDDGEATLEPRGDVDKRQRRGTEQGRQEDQKEKTLPRADARDDDEFFDGDDPPAGDELIGGKYTAPFEKWWSEYPQKEGKGEAAKCYERAFKRLGGKEKGTERIHAWLLHSLKAQVSLWKRKGVVGKFIPRASTWLNGSRFDDEGVQVEVRRAREPAALARGEVIGTVLTPPTPPPAKPETLGARPRLGWSPSDEER